MTSDYSREVPTRSSRLPGSDKSFSRLHAAGGTVVDVDVHRESGWSGSSAVPAAKSDFPLPILPQPLQRINVCAVSLAKCFGCVVKFVYFVTEAKDCCRIV
jgi:hypothetical protein